ncbi:hypothetical protein Lal_00035349 [Lupinus albus]|nr:hypothetical protein Lal_00035349 [Lupinus albus]
MNWFLFEATSPQGWMLSILRVTKSITNFIAHNSKRKGVHTCIHIGGAYSRQVKIYHQTLVCHHQKGGDCEEDLAPDLGTVLMKTPTSPKRRKVRRLKTTKKIKLQDY